MDSASIPEKLEHWNSLQRALHDDVLRRVATEIPVGEWQEVLLAFDLCCGRALTGMVFTDGEWPNERGFRARIQGFALSDLQCLHANLFSAWWSQNLNQIAAPPGGNAEGVLKFAAIVYQQTPTFAAGWSEFFRENRATDAFNVRAVYRLSEGTSDKFAFDSPDDPRLAWRWIAVLKAVDACTNSTISRPDWSTLCRGWMRDIARPDRKGTTTGCGVLIAGLLAISALAGAVVCAAADGVVEGQPSLHAAGRDSATAAITPNLH